MIRNTLHKARAAFVAFDELLDAWAERHWPVLSAVGYALSFVMLFGAVALHAYETGLAHVTRVQCGPACLATPGFEYLAAALWGGAAILFVKFYARVAAAVQREFFDPFQVVRPEPPRKKVARWATVLFVLIGIVFFFVMVGLATEQTPGQFKLSLGRHGGLELLLRWWVAGCVVLGFFWPKHPGSLPLRRGVG